MSKSPPKIKPATLAPTRAAGNEPPRIRNASMIISLTKYSVFRDVSFGAKNRTINGCFAVPRKQKLMQRSECMSDYKDVYSEESQYYVEQVVSSYELDRKRYERSKQRESKYNDQWKKHPVNLNDVCNMFAPGDQGHKEGVKFVFSGNTHEVKADMASGYLRIYNKDAHQYVKLDGTPGTADETHFKILRREEM